MKIKAVLIMIVLQSFFCFSQKNEPEIKQSNETLYIPVVFNILTSKEHSNEKKKMLNNTVKYLIHSLNDRLNTNLKSKVIEEFKEKIGVPNIKFFLPNCDKYNNPISSISWHKSPYYPSGAHIPVLEDHILKKYNYLNPKEFLNIWLLDLIDLKWKIKICGKKINIADLDLEGHAPKRIIDGILLDIDDYNEFLYDPSTIIHEVGHYLGLNHIWGKQNGCKFDDGILDTPPQEKSHLYLEKPQISCDEKKANHQNYMDYTAKRYMFTKGQVAVMRNHVKKERSGLLWKPNCSNDNSITGYIKDTRDNQSYKWVQIENQKWMTQNLNYKTDNSKCYDNKETNCTVYGRLYNWDEAINICPTGWRLPSKSDWEKLTRFVQNKQGSIRSKNGWLKGKNGTNTTGLNILPSGYKFSYGGYSGLGKYSKIWLSNSSGTSAYSRDIGERGYDKLAQAGINFKRDLLSCRCIQDGQSTSNNSDIQPYINNSNNQQSSSVISDDFLIGEWKGDVSTYIFRKDKKYIIKSNNSSRNTLPPTPYTTWSYKNEFLILKNYQSKPLNFKVKIISPTKIALYNNGRLFGYFNKQEINRDLLKPTINENIKKLNNRNYNRSQQNTKKKKKGVTLKDLLKKQN